MSTELVIQHDVVDAPNLAELAETVKREHGQVLGALGDAVRHALVAGHALIAARRAVPRGGWRTWLSEAEISQATAVRYMRIATYEEIAKTAPSMKAAGKALIGLPPVTPLGYPAPPGLSDDVKKLHAAGMSLSEIASTLDVHPHTVARHLDPAMRERNRTTSSQAQKRRRDAKRALAKQERDEMMKTVGGDERDAYLTARKLAGLLDKFGMSSEYAKVVAIEDALAERAKAKLI